jgi:pyruvate/2-oxoglutarate/acetoin dehydrogenase E1 component
LRVTYPDTHAPFSHVLEQANLPNVARIVEGVRKLAAY